MWWRLAPSCNRSDAVGPVRWWRCLPGRSRARPIERGVEIVLVLVASSEDRAPAGRAASGLGATAKPSLTGIVDVEHGYRDVAVLEAVQAWPPVRGFGDHGELRLGIDDQAGVGGKWGDRRRSNPGIHLPTPRLLTNPDPHGHRGSTGGVRWCPFHPACARVGEAQTKAPAMGRAEPDVRGEPLAIISPIVMSVVLMAVPTT